MKAGIDSYFNLQLQNLALYPELKKYLPIEWTGIRIIFHPCDILHWASIWGLHFGNDHLSNAESEAALI